MIVNFNNCRWGRGGPAFVQVKSCRFSRESVRMFINFEFSKAKNLLKVLYYNA